MWACNLVNVQIWNGARFCLVDEYGIGLYTSRTRGRAVKGSPAKKISGNQLAPHITLLCAITPNIGVINHTIIVGGAKRSHFDQSFLNCFNVPLVIPVPQVEVDTTYTIPGSFWVTFSLFLEYFITMVDFCNSSNMNNLWALEQ